METTKCPSCDLEHSSSETAAHADVCPAAIVACEQAAYGCDWTGVRLAFRETHLRSCPYVALRGFFRISDAKAGALQAENARLRARLDTVEGMLAVMRHELQAVKGALGPWYRPEAGPESAPLSSPQPQAFSQPPSYTFSTSSSTPTPTLPWRGPHEPPADIMLHVPIPPSEDPSSILDSVSLTHAHAHGPPHAGIARPDLAAYFPPPSGDAPASPPSSGHSLSAALTALRTALLNHDARSRMAASAQAAELAAMRQVVAGLRMQLYAVLIERSGANAADGTGVGAGGWNSPARFFLSQPPPLGVSHGPVAASITKL